MLPRPGVDAAAAEGPGRTPACGRRPQNGYRVDRLFAGYKGPGHNALRVDDRGHGVSSGSTSKQGMHADARAMVAYLRQVRGAGLNDIVIHGWSIGSAPAIETAVAMNNDRKIEPMHTPCLILKGRTDSQGFRDMADKLAADAFNASLSTFNGGHADHDAIFQGASGGRISRFLAWSAPREHPAGSRQGPAQGVGARRTQRSSSVSLGHCTADTFFAIAQVSVRRYSGT